MSIGSTRIESTTKSSTIVVFPEPFPTFLFKPITAEECRSLNIGGCTNVSATSNNRSADAFIYVNCDGTSGTIDEFVAISSRLGSLDKGRPIRVDIDESKTVPVVFQPVRKVILSLTICKYLNSLATSKLPNLGIPNLLRFAVFRCNGMIIRKEDFAANTKLRVIIFHEATIDSIETVSFTNLPDRQHLSLEAVWKRPFTSEFIAHLLRLLCNCEYSWFQRWLKQNPILTSPKKIGEMHRIGQFFNPDWSRKETFWSIVCVKFWMRWFLMTYNSVILSMTSVDCKE